MYEGSLLCPLYPLLVSSVWSFYARFSDVISRGNRCWRREMLAVFSGEAGLSTRGNATLDARNLTERLLTYAPEKFICNDAKVR